MFFIKRKKSDKPILLLICLVTTILLCTLLSVCGLKNKETEAYAMDSNATAKNDDYAYINLKEDHVVETTVLNIPVSVVSESVIVDFTYEETDFEVLSSKTENSHNLLFTLKCLFFGEHELHIHIKMSDKTELSASLYAFCTDFGIFLSTFSRNDALKKYIDYTLNNSILTESEAEELIEKLSSKSSTDEDDTLEVNNTSTKNKRSIAKSSTRSGDTTAYGTLTWNDGRTGDIAIHPLRRIKVELRDSDLIGSQLLGTTFTENDGSYSISFTNDSSAFENGGCDLFLRIFAGDDNADVVKSDGITKYYVDTSYTDHQNVATGISEMIDHTVNMSTYAGKAIQISQALMTAQDFAWDMIGGEDMPASVKAVFPATGEETTCYNNNKIYVCDFANDHDYADWDVIMHEYGHHIAYHARIDNSPGGWHMSNKNMAVHFLIESGSDCNNKCAKHMSNPVVTEGSEITAGKKLAWSEGWATTFALIAQQYESSQIENITSVNGPIYDDNGIEIMNIESGLEQSGDACEETVSEILWDIFDSGTETNGNDNIGLGYQNWWNVTTGSQAKDFFEFVQYFYQQYPSYIDELGNNLSYHNIATSCVYQVEGEMHFELTPYEFGWDVLGGSNFLPNNVFVLRFYDKDYLCAPYEVNVNLSEEDLAGITNEDSSIYKIPTLNDWLNHIIPFPGEIVHVTVGTKHSSTMASGYYFSRFVDFTKPIFTTTILNSGDVKITGTYCDIFGELRIPEKIDNRNVTQIGDEAFSRKSMTRVTFENASIIQSIGERAFYYCPNLSYAVIPQNVETLETGLFESIGGQLLLRFMGNLKNIGARVFMENDMSNMDPFPDSIETIGNNAFMSTIVPNNLFSKGTMNLKSIGTAAFTGSDIKTIILPKHEAPNAELTISTLAFYLANYLTIYTPYNTKPSTWSTTWNASNRPVIWGCTLSSDSKYVVSFNKTSSNPSNATAPNGMNNPTRSGYTFGGWYTTSDYSGTKYDDIASAPNGTLYAKWTSSSCIAAGSLITLADGSQVAVENLTGNENLLVWNMLTGQYDTAPILFIDSDPLSSYEIIKLTFSDNTEVKVIDEHAFFDMTIGEYVFMRNDASQYIGHYFNKQGINGTYTTVQLINVTVYNETTTAWSPVTYGHLCYYVNGMLSMPGATEGLINIFDVDTTLMKYDAVQMSADIQTYGLYTYEEFNAIIPLPELVFNAFNGQYLKVSIGKGLITLDEIAALLERYAALLE